MAADKEIKQARDFLDDNILEFSDVLKHKELHDLAKWCDDELINGSALHIIIEDGNYLNSNVDYCLEYILSGEWESNEEAYPVLANEKVKLLRILELMKPLTVEKREMIIEGSTITNKLFDLLYNQAIT